VVVTCFNPKAICPKCWSEDVSARYRRSYDQYVCRYVDEPKPEYGTWDGDEHLHRRCERCGFQWREEVVSA
jgi:hypothetical protein